MKEYINKIISYTVLVGSLILGTGCGSKYNVRGFIVNEKRWEQPGFGQIYRVEVAPNMSSRTGSPYVFIGSNEELEGLDNRINVGDEVKINDQSTAFSLSLEKVLLPKQIKKK